MVWGIPAAVLLALLWLLVRRRRFVAFSAVSQLQLLRHRPSILRRMPIILAAIGLGLIVVCLMEPVLPYSESRIEARGLDLVLVVDLSSSMAEPMSSSYELPPDAFRLPPGGATAPRRPRVTRLDATKQALRDFIRQRRDDRIGLVVFSDNAYIISPLTFDYEYLIDYVNGIDDTLLRMEGMTAIGEGIHLANVLLARQSREAVKNKVVVVFTDGEHNAGRDPIQVLEETNAAGFRAHLIGVDLDKAIREKPAVVNLIRTVHRYGGQYFQAGNTRQLAAANAALATLEKGRLAGKRFVYDVPVFDWFAKPAMILLALALGLRIIPYFSELT